MGVPQQSRACKNRVKVRSLFDDEYNFKRRPRAQKMGLYLADKCSLKTKLLLLIDEAYHHLWSNLLRGTTVGLPLPNSGSSIQLLPTTNMSHKALPL